MASQDHTIDVITSIFGEYPSSDNESQGFNNNNNPSDEYATHGDDEMHDGDEGQIGNPSDAITEMDLANIGPEPDDVEVGNFDVTGPQVGMIFKSRDELVDAYMLFGKMKGFSPSIRSSRATYIQVKCDRGRINDNPKKRTKRIACEAYIAASNKQEFWVVTIVVREHNHPMDPDKSKFMAGHRTITYAQKRHLENVDISGVPICKNIRLLQFQAGGPGKLSCSERDCRTYIDKMRRLRLGDGDASAIHKLFNRMKLQDPSFFHLMDVADDNTLNNVMWIHPRSKDAYQEFHEVISFNTTYLVNRYNMPFASVVGINHHHQSILLGCALLSHEQSDSFKSFIGWMLWEEWPRVQF